METSKDGLVKANSLIIEKDQCIGKFVLKNNDQCFYLDPKIESLFEYLSYKEELINKAYIKLDTKSLGLKRVPWFGQNFDQAIKFAKQKSTSKSRFVTYDGTQSEFVKADLRVHVEPKDGQIQIEAWQIGFQKENPENSETFYLHGFIDIEKDIFTHFDGAVMFLSKQEREDLYENGKKPKNGTYQKYFRLDGEIPVYEIIELSKLFMPAEELVSEFFNR